MLSIMVLIYYIFVKMRYQQKAQKSLSYMLRDAYTRVDSKQNKENNNNINLQPSKQYPHKNNILCPLKIQHKISESTHTSTVSKFLKKENFGETLKKEYTENIVGDYSDEILKHLCQTSDHTKNFLSRHTITASLRSKMVDWMIEVLSSYKMSQQTFFRSVKIMDKFLMKCEQKQELKDLHLIGITSMFSAAKNEEIHPLKLQVIYDKIARKKFKKTEILEKESEVILNINFMLDEPTVYDLTRHITQHLSLPYSESSLSYFQKIILYLSKMALFSIQLAEANTAPLCVGVFFIGLKTLEQVDPSVDPQAKLSEACNLLQVHEDEVVEISRNILQLAKNYSKIYPNLSNLKKFNKFQYGNQ